MPWQTPLALSVNISQAALRSLIIICLGEVLSAVADAFICYNVMTSRCYKMFVTIVFSDTIIYAFVVTTTTTTGALRERKPPLTPKFQPKVIRDSNPDFTINPDPDPDHRMSAGSIPKCCVCIILSASVILNQPLTVRNANKCPKSSIPQRWKKWKNYTKSTRRSGSTPKVDQFRVTPCPCLPSLVDVRFRVRQLSCIQNDRMTEPTMTTSALLAEVTTTTTTTTTIIIIIIIITATLRENS